MSRPLNFVASLLLLFAVFATSVHGKGTTAEPGSRAELTVTEQKNLETLTAFFEALNRYDAEGMAELMTEGFEFRYSSGVLVSGREAGSVFFAGRPPNRPLYTIELVVVGNRGWHLFSFEPPDADGKSVPTGLDLMTMREGKIAIKDYYRKVPPKNETRLVDEWFAALQAHDTERWVSLHSDSVIWSFPQNGGRLEGAEALRRAIDGFIARQPDIRFEKKSQVSSGGTVAVEWVELGTELATGKPVEYNFSGFLTIKDGKVTEVQRYGGLRASE